MTPRVALVTGAGRGIGRATAEALADEMDADRLGVVAVCPGQVNTPLAWKTGVAKAERPHLIQPESVARVIAELAAGRRRFKNGEAIDVTR